MNENTKTYLSLVIKYALGIGVIAIIIYVIVYYSKPKAKLENTSTDNSNLKNIGENCSFGNECKSGACANEKCV